MAVSFDFAEISSILLDNPRLTADLVDFELDVPHTGRMAVQVVVGNQHAAFSSLRSSLAGARPFKTANLSVARYPTTATPGGAN